MSDSEDDSGVLFLQQQMVAITRQLSIPLIEVSLVLQKYTKALVGELQNQAQMNGEELPAEILHPLPLNPSSCEDVVSTQIDPERLLKMVDADRMDIFDTVIRSAINEHSTPLYDALLVIRDWERIARIQLSNSTSVGQLFSPIELSDDF